MLLLLHSKIYQINRRWLHTSNFYGKEKVKKIEQSIKISDLTATLAVHPDTLPRIKEHGRDIGDSYDEILNKLMDKVLDGLTLIGLCCA